MLGVVASLDAKIRDPHPFLAVRINARLVDPRPSRIAATQIAQVPSSAP